jgi:hypothetical protein
LRQPLHQEIYPIEDIRRAASQNDGPSTIGSLFLYILSDREWSNQSRFRWQTTLHCLRLELNPHKWSVNVAIHCRVQDEKDRDQPARNSELD